MLDLINRPDDSDDDVFTSLVQKADDRAIILLKLPASTVEGLAIKSWLMAHMECGSLPTGGGGPFQVAYEHAHSLGAEMMRAQCVEAKRLSPFLLSVVGPEAERN